MTVVEILYCGLQLFAESCNIMIIINGIFTLFQAKLGKFSPKHQVSPCNIWVTGAGQPKIPDFVTWYKGVNLTKSNFCFILVFFENHVKQKFGCLNWFVKDPSRKKDSWLGGHSITTWTGGGGEGVSQMSMIVHAREGGGLVFSMWTFWGECTIFAPKWIVLFTRETCAL